MRWLLGFETRMKRPGTIRAWVLARILGYRRLWPRDEASRSNGTLPGRFCYDGRWLHGVRACWKSWRIS